MAEVSTINGYIIKDKKAIRYYNTVADMVADTTLKNGMHAITKGYYSINDGGGADYHVTNTESETDHQELINNNLYATLLIKGKVNVKQLGAYGDGVHDDTLIINTAMNKYKNVFIPYGTYEVDYVFFREGCNVDGNLSTINTAISSTHLNAIESNCIIKNVTINSTNTDREWNRIDLTESKNVTLENCTFSGFRQETIPAGAVGKNVWGLYLRQSENISIINCLFSNNNFEDIIIEYGCKNLSFINIDTVDGNGVKIDIEPSTNNDLYNIKFDNCNMYFIHTSDYYYTGTNTHGITLTNCKIGELAYHGSDLTLINCTVTNYRGLLINNEYYGGALKLINSATFSDNLIQDSYFDDVSNVNSSYWKITYNSTTWTNLIRSIKDSDGIFTVLNPDNLSHNIIICTNFINVTSNTSYLLRTILKSHNPSNGNQVSTHARITYYTNDEAEISKHICSINRHPLNTTSKLTDESILFNTPENCTKIKIEYRSGPGSSTQSAYLKSCGLYAISSNQYTNSNLPSFKERKYREFYKDIKPTANYINYSIGDKIFYNTPTTYIGAVCTDGTTQGGTWVNFGQLES